MTTDYREIGSELGELLNSKQRAYGNVFGVTPAIIELLFPGGIPVTAYKDVLALVRVLDKVGRICTAAGRADPSGESPWSDIAGYAMLMLRRGEKKEPAVPPMRYRVSYGDPEGTMTTWGWYDSRHEALEAAERCREEHPEPATHVEDMRPDPPPSNDWALTWALAGSYAFIESVFPTRELAEARRREMAGAQPNLTWRVCRVDEVGK